MATAAERISAVPAPFEASINSEACPESHLPWLAWQFSVDMWEPDWPIYVRRNAVHESLKIHRRKGTVAAVREAIGAIGVPVEIEEWHQQVPRGQPYTFRVLINSVVTPVSKSDIRRLLESIDRTKNVRSHLTGLIPGLTTYSNARFAAATIAGVTRQVNPRYRDVSLLLAAIEEGEAEVSQAVARLHHHIHYDLPNLSANP